MRIRKTAAITLLAGTLLTLPACGRGAGDRTPEEWLSLAYSGLASTDQYAFTGSMSIKTAAGLEFKPEIFEGKVVDHKQLTVQTSSQEPLRFNPVQVLQSLNETNEEVTIENGGAGKDTITLHITEKSEASTEKWKQRLRGELDRIGEDAGLAPSAGSGQKDEWTKELDRSKRQLEDMLSTLQAYTEYELVIDRDRLLPLSMDERTSFRYAYKSKPASEERQTTVRFQSFDGSTSATVQRALNRVRMN